MSLPPTLVPERDLKGATPEALARALLARRVGQPVVRGKPTVQQVPADKPRDD